MPPAQRAAYQRALSLDAKRMPGEGAAVSTLAGRRNSATPMMVKLEKMDPAGRAGGVPSGFQGGMAVGPPRGNGTSNLNP